MRFIQYIAVGILTSFYFFPIGFSFLPDSINTKMILAVLGALLYGSKCLMAGQTELSKSLFGAILIACVFSMVGFISIDINHTEDYSYATYFVSFGVWLAGAFTVCSAITAIHGRANFKLLTFYLSAVCFAQCVAALMIDSTPSFQFFVDGYIAQGQDFISEVDRLYGIGAALDPAGVRFSIVLIMIVGLLCKDAEVRRSRVQIFLLLLAFFMITIVGNIISRTTILGVGCAALYFVFSSGLFRNIIHYESIKLGLWFGGILIASILIATYLYQTDEVFNGHMRFAFEGFFNWAETGVWRTDSTDKLNRDMWVWPADLKTWIIGSGIFEDWAYNTDIGYCRFILYCGLVGFLIFAFMFVYLTVLFSHQNPKYWLMFVFLMALTFLVWIKVSTDIFLIYALFFCLDRFVEEPAKSEENYENSLQYSGNI